MPIRTARLALLPLSRAAATAVVDGAAPREHEWGRGYPFEGDVVAARMWLASGGPAPPWTAYQVLFDDVVIGGCGFHGPPQDGEVEIGYGFPAAWRGRGFATECVAALLGVAAQHEADRVVATTAAGNLPSRRVLLRCGFVENGVRNGELCYERSLAELR
jgi:RimJ/RimL family protein N-acetyltransferase